MVVAKKIGFEVSVYNKGSGGSCGGGGGGALKGGETLD